MPTQSPMSPSPSEVGFSLSRRSVLAGMLGAAGVAAVPGLAACGSSSSGGGGGSTSKTVSVGSNASDQVPKDAYAAVYKSFTEDSGVTVEVNTVDHNTFQEQINTYLQGKPQDVFTWFAGYRMRYFAAKGLATEINDVWADQGDNYSEALKGASTGDDGNQYFLPFYYYPWAVFYRKSVFADNGWTAPKTLDELKTLATSMKSKGLAPIAFADKDGWPAMGTFDILNMRINGYDFHIRLMAGKARWDSPQVKKVFNTWREILPYTSEGALGLTWQEGAQQLLNKEAGMYMLGTFVGQQFTGAAAKDLDFFAYPAINPKWGQDSIDAPIDGFALTKKAKNVTEAKQLLTYLGTAAAANIYLKSDPNNFGANKNTNKTKYTATQKKSAALVAKTAHIAQFLDRDTRPDFASTVMIPAIQTFLNKPNDVNSLCSSIQKQKKAIFGF